MSFATAPILWRLGNTQNFSQRSRFNQAIKMRCSVSTISRLVLPVLLGAWGGVLSAPSLSWAEEKIDFTRQIRPLLSENCFHCHGPDAQQRAADLRLDQADGARLAIPSRDRAESELYQRISSKDPDLQMPPPDSNRSLTPEQVELIGKWIEAGATWDEHWSWRPLTAPPVPELLDTPGQAQQLHNPIDAFVQARLQARNLTPSPEADRATLLRRVAFDLTGLPPAPEEVERFLNDDAPDAYEQLVDRLLASPTYGERMSWDWLDAARYSDTNGYQGDRERTMWPWRDWVVSAFNENLPFDQFTIWQLAGDLLPDATFEQKLATGFCRNHMINGEGGRIADENRVDYVMDMVETTGTVWLGLTFNCCRCHDHKFDDLSQRDYYQFFDFFNQTPVTGGGGDPQTRPVLEAPTSDQQTRLAALRDQQQQSDQRLAEQARQLQLAEADWATAKLVSLTEESAWLPFKVHSAVAEHQQLTLREDLSVFAAGENPLNDTYTVEVTAPGAVLAALRLDVLRDASHTQGGLARSDSGNFVLTEIEVERLQGETWQRISIASAEATFEQGELKVTKAFDGDRKSGWAVYAGKPIDRDHAAVFRLAEPVTLQSEERLRVTLRHDSVHAHHNIGLFRLSAASNAEAPLNDEGTLALRTALMTPAAQRTAEQAKLVTSTHQQSDADYQTLTKQREEIAEKIKAVQGQIAKVMVMEDQPQRRSTFVLERGLYNAPTEHEVSAAVPTSLPPLPARPDEGAANRLDLANWLVSADNPLTARVVVNRFWQQLFGTGLVKTANDFGVQGEIPIHEDLLNWLAVDFRDSGWDVKRLLRQMVLSHTYRQSSQVTPELLDVDPENRLLARAPRYRLPSWMLRDQALAVSGLLNPQFGGPSVKVYQPPGIWEEATFGQKKYVPDTGDALYRRSLYIFWRRIVGPSVFFDNAARQVCSVDVYRTNTPLHALLTFNDVTYVEAARVLAEQFLQQADLTNAQRFDRLVQRVLVRSSLDSEREIFLTGLARTSERFSENPAAARELLAMGEAPRDLSLNEVEHASWTLLCLSLLNLDEALTKE